MTKKKKWERNNSPLSGQFFKIAHPPPPPRLLTLSETLSFTVMTQESKNNSRVSNPDSFNLVIKEIDFNSTCQM